MFVLPSYRVHVSEYSVEKDQKKLPYNLFETPVQSSISTEHPSWSSESSDQRLGPLRVEFLTIRSSSNMYLKNKQANTSFARFEKVDSFKADPPDEPYDEKVIIDVPFGIVHLFRNLSESKDPANAAIDKASEISDSEIGTTLAMLNVPSSFSTSQLLSFVGSALNTVQHIRLIQYVSNTNMQSRAT